MSKQEDQIEGFLRALLVVVSLELRYLFLTTASLESLSVH